MEIRNKICWCVIIAANDGKNSIAYDGYSDSLAVYVSKHEAITSREKIKKSKSKTTTLQIKHCIVQVLE